MTRMTKAIVTMAAAAGMLVTAGAIKSAVDDPLPQTRVAVSTPTERIDLPAIGTVHDELRRDLRPR